MKNVILNNTKTCKDAQQRINAVPYIRLFSVSGSSNHAHLLGFHFMFLHCCDYHTVAFWSLCPQMIHIIVTVSSMMQAYKHAQLSFSDTRTCISMLRVLQKQAWHVLYKTSLYWSRKAALSDFSSYLEKMRLCKHQTSKTMDLSWQDHFSFSSSSLRPALAPFISKNPCAMWETAKPSVYSFSG